MIKSQRQNLIPKSLRNLLLRDSALATPVSDMRTMTGLLGAYWRGDKKREAMLLESGVLLLSAAIGYNSVQIGLQYAEVAANLFNYHTLDTPAPFDTLMQSTMSAAGYTVLQTGMVVSRHLMSTNLHRKWAGWLRTQFSDALLGKQNAAYHIRNCKVPDSNGTLIPLENVDQRMTECTKNICGAVIGLSMGAVMASSAFMSAAKVLIDISQPITALPFLGQYGTAVTAFVAAASSVSLGTYAAYKIGKKITDVNKRFQETEATYRNSINTVSRSAFYIAASAGEKIEKRINKKNYQDVDNAWYKHIFVHAGFMGYIGLYNPFSSRIVAYLPALANYASNTMGLKDYLKTTGTISSVMNSMEWFIDVMPALANLKTNIDRVTDVAKAIHSVHDPKIFYQQAGVSDFIYKSQDSALGIYARNLELMHEGHDAKAFLKIPRLRLTPGDWAQIEGPNGAGKSCFMKAIEGKYLWPYGRGVVAVNDKLKTIYATQDIELQNVSLKQLVSYPDLEGICQDQAVIDVLEHVGLQKILPYLHENGKNNNTWNETLSGGEKQKLILARILLQRPDVLFLDEANSAMDVASKENFYALLKKHCGTSILLAVLHEASPPRQDSGEPYFNYKLKIEDGVMTQEAVQKRNDFHTSYERNYLHGKNFKPVYSQYPVSRPYQGPQVL